MIERTSHCAAVLRKLARFPVVAIIGARQVGKTTLAKMLRARWRATSTHFDLENSEDRALLQDPMLALKPLKGLVVLDEVQRLPDLFPSLRVLADRPRTPARYLVLGSASPELLRQGSETLAGRIAYHDLGGFSLDEIGASDPDKLWLRGGFPRSFLARSLRDSSEWRAEFVRSFLERDLFQLGISIPAATLQRFWTMLAGYHGQHWNSSEFARSFGVSDTTVRRYLDSLTSALMIRQVPPWHENISKRQVKAPKVYLKDSGLLHSLLRIGSQAELERHVKVGASWEGFAIEQLLHHLGARSGEYFSWGTYSGAELDLFVLRGQRRLGFEIKRTSSPAVTRSMHIALEDLDLTRLDVIHAGDRTYPLAKRIRALAFSRLLEDLDP